MLPSRRGPWSAKKMLRTVSVSRLVLRPGTPESISNVARIRVSDRAEISGPPAHSTSVHRVRTIQICRLPSTVDAVSQACRVLIELTAMLESPTDK